MHAFGNKMTDIGATMSTRLTLPIVAMGGAMVKAFTVQEDAVARMTAALKANGGQAGITSQEIQSMASSLQKVTTFGDEATISASALLLTFHQVRNEMGKGNDIFNRTIKAAQDLSSALGIDLQSATMQLAKALENPIIGVGALARSGTTFTVQQKEMIKTLVESGRQLEAQAMILDEVEKLYKGTAETVAKTVSGQISQAFNAFGDEMEAFGKIIAQDFVIPVLEAVGKVTDFLNGLEEGTRKTVVAFAGLTALVGPLLVGLGLMTSSVANLTRVMMANPYIALGAAILAIGTYAVFSSGALDSMNSKVLKALDLEDGLTGKKEEQEKIYKRIVDLSQALTKEQKLLDSLGMDAVEDQVRSSKRIDDLRKEIIATTELLNQSEKLGAQTAASKKELDNLLNNIKTDGVNNAIGSIGKLREELKKLQDEFETTGDAILRVELDKKINSITSEISYLQAVARAGILPASAPVTIDRATIATQKLTSSVGGLRRGFIPLAETPEIISAMTAEMVIAQQFANQFTDSFGAGMANVVLQGENLIDVLKNIGKLLLSSAIQTGIKLLLMGTSGFGVAGGSTGLLGGLFKPQVSAVPSAVMGAGTMQMSGSFKLQGTDLIMSVNRSQRQFR
jgi:hypothetical protein